MSARGPWCVDRDSEHRQSPTRTLDLDSQYERLAFDLNDGDGGDSISGYQCANPFADDLIAAVKSRAEGLDYRRYTYFDDHGELVSAIRELHDQSDGLTPQGILCGSGASSQLFAVATYLQKKGTRRVFFIPPLYFTLRIALERYGIVAHPVAREHPYQDGFRLLLPRETNSCLLLTDPIWFTGTPIAPDIIESVVRWQRETSSLVVVDGSFQYLPWNGERRESTAKLDPSLTIRLLCPTKQLAVHGYRFSYLLVPVREWRHLAWAQANIVGAASAESIAFAHEAMAALSRRGIPSRLMSLASARHRSLRASGSIESEIQPSCGYFVFEKINCPLPEGHVLVDGTFFEQGSFPGYAKINLLSPSMRIFKRLSVHGDSASEQ